MKSPRAFRKQRKNLEENVSVLAPVMVISDSLCLPVTVVVFFTICWLYF